MSDLRLYIVFRSDLPEMTRAKGEVQAAHAAASMIFRAFTNPDDPDTAQKMFEYMGDFTDEVTEGQAKVLMEVDDFSGLEAIQKLAKKRGVNSVLIRDAARTVFDQPTYTCIGIGPCSKTDGNAITRKARKRA